MIPKKIHYCWFGGKEMPRLEQKCIKSWKQIMPDYEIIRWDESNFNINEYPFALEAYKKKKFAFVADVCRLHVLYNNGGIYLDTDIEVLKRFDNLLNQNLFLGFETDQVIQTGVIGSKPYNEIILGMLKYYQTKKGFDIKRDGAIANSELFANMFRKQNIPLENNNYISEALSLYSSEYFCPINQATWEIKVTPNSYCIHYLSGSWLPYKDRLTRSIKSILGHSLGFETVNKLRKLIR